MAKLKALVLAFDGIEEIEALTVVDILRRAEIDVTIASVEGQPQVRGRNDITFQVDAPLSQVYAGAFELIVLPGGPGVLELLENATVGGLLLKHNGSGKKTAAICAAPKVLAHLGLLDDKTATSHASVRGDLPRASGERVIIDGLITTSQGVGTAIEFSLSLVAQLRGADLAQQIAASIHAPD